MKINVESHVHLELKFETKSELFAVMNSIIPDNIDCPDGLVVEMYDKHNCLVFDISCKREIFVIMSTVDEILRHIVMAKQVISNA
ncbi:MAG: hypothetical protein WA395_07155 [Nitrososphaeraceae archaeon]